MARHFGGAPVRQADRARLLLFFGFFGLVAFSGLTYVALSLKKEAAPVPVAPVDAAPAMVDVLVPLRDIDAGVQLQASMFKKEKRPAEIAVQGKLIHDFEEIMGSFFARTLIVSGQPLHADLITDKRPTTAISTAIPPGYRAVTIRVNETSSVEGWARPGSTVDVVWASLIRGQAGITVIVQNAKVLSAERQVGGPGNQPPPPGTPVPSTVTLLVSAKDATKIHLASTAGTLSLSLRGDNDPGKAEQVGSITLNDLLGDSKQPQQLVPDAKGTVTMGGKKWIVGHDGKLSPLGGD